MSSIEIRGRFLPSRVYSRWKWTVRFGLLLVPFLSLLSGGLVLYLTPGKYRSSTLFELANGPPPLETLELLKSRGILELVTRRLDLTHRLNVDHETAMENIRETTEVEIIPNTRLIRLSVTFANKINSRDLAAEIPAALEGYLLADSKRRNAEKAEELERLIRDASDIAEEKAAALGNHEKVHGTGTDNAALTSARQRAQRGSLLADAEVERLQALKANCLTENLDTLPRLIVHSAPVISGEPCAPESGPELNELVGRSLVLGLLAALLLPYLMELALPPRGDRVSKSDPAIDP